MVYSVGFDKYDKAMQDNILALERHGNPDLLRWYVYDKPEIQFYMPENDRGQWPRSKQYDWNSIMSCDGTEYAMEGKFVMKRNGLYIDISEITEPSDSDKAMVKEMYAGA